MEKSKRVLVGHIGVDAGLCWIGDPCYILHKEDGLPESLGKNWGDFCNTLGEVYPTLKTFGFSNKDNEGLGVCVSTGWGDGYYPVYATIKAGRVARISVDFNV
jgi:hypothetical protein